MLNGHPGILPETVERVHKAMDELGFQPNALARGLRGGRTGIIGVCFQELETPILARKVSLLQQSLRELGYHALIELTNGNKDGERAALRNFLSLQVEGVVLIGSQLTETDEVLAGCLSQGRPVIWVDPETKVDGEQMSIDRPISMKLVLEHLYGLGHRRYAVLGIDPVNPFGAFRWPAFQRNCKRLGIDIEKHTVQLFIEGHPLHDYNYGRTLAERLLESDKSLPTAVIAVNDRVAIGAINRLREAGVETPRDVSVVGYDNLEVTEHLQPALTTIDQCAEHLMLGVAERMKQLLESDEDSPKPKQTLIKPRLIERDSTRAQ